jgi:hypothetical protein
MRQVSPNVKAQASLRGAEGSHSCWALRFTGYNPLQDRLTEAWKELPVHFSRSLDFVMELLEQYTKLAVIK